MSKFSTILMSQADTPSYPNSIEGDEETEEEAESEATKDGPKSSRHAPRPSSRFCCISKEYFSEYTNLVDSLHISPRLIIHKSRFRKNCTYGLTLSIRNNGLYPRKINISTDSPVDTAIVIKQPELYTFLDTDKVVHVKINIRSSTNNKINRPRHIFIQSFHPNITFQVPILVLKDLMSPYTSEYITMPSSVPPERTQYEMILYNPGIEPITVKYKSSFSGVTLSYLNKNLILPEDYVKLLVRFDPKKLQVYRGFFNVKFGLAPPKIVVFDYVPKSMSVYINRGYISFGLTKFGETITRSVIVCNESPHRLTVSSSFYTAPSDFASLEDSEASSISLHSALLYDLEDNKATDDVSFREDAYIHFSEDCPQHISPFASEQVTLKFQPKDSETFSEDVKPPFRQRTKINFCFTDAMDCLESHFVIVVGEIMGIEVETYPKVIDFRKIYLGEEHCALIKILNVDSSVAKVNYVDCSDTETSGVRVTPVEGYSLKPCDRGVFHLSFFTISPTSIYLTLRFKVRNGWYYNIVVKGTGQVIQLRTFPQLVEFGNVPFGVPQKRFMLLMNPLAVPITLQVKPTDDGTEQPLVFNIRDSDMLPITIKDPIKELQALHEQLIKNDWSYDTDVELTNEAEDLLSMKSISVNQSEYSTQFEEDIMIPIPQMAANLLKNLKKSRVLDKTETDKRVIQEALGSLLNTNYFDIMKKHNNFIFLDWNAVPSDPSEVYCDNEIIYLRPNTGRSITVLIIPNRAGYFHRSLTVRICPTMPVSSSESSENSLKTLIKSEYLCSKLWIEYNCLTPTIEWSNHVDLTYRIIYAGEEYFFDMEFYNVSKIGGFLHYDVIPNEMAFRDGNWKFYIGTNSVIAAKCAVVFRVLGVNKLSGLLRVVGDSHPYPFHVIANVLPTEINISLKNINVRLKVYEYHKLHLYIDNVSPTFTVISMKLKDVSYQRLTTRGCKLSPLGQSTYTTLMSMFPDPDLYLNTLYIDLQFDNIIEIPIKFLVEGVPIYFDPDIKDGFDAGLLLTDTKENFKNNIFAHKFPVKLTNRGFRPYRLNVTRLTTYNPEMKVSACSYQPLSARFDIQPKVVELPPQEHEYIDVLMTSYEEGLYFCDFLLTVTDLKYPQRKYVIRLTIQAQFVDSQLTWDRRQLNFKFQAQYPLKERPQSRSAKLCSQVNVPFTDVALEVVGPFRIKEIYEHAFERKITVSLGKMEHKNIIVGLNRSSMKQTFCKVIEGRINVFAMGRAHQSLTLRLSVLVPEVHVIYPELVLFDRGRPFDYNVSILSAGCTDADFKWRRLDEEDRFIGADDPADAVAEILSEIIRTLEYNFSCDEEANLTLRYQQCICQFRRDQENDSLIFEIIDEIINELDLEHRRFHIPLEPLEGSHDHSDCHSSSSYVHYTIEYILDMLHLESSQQLSEASSDYCYLDRFIYFYEKTGQVPQGETKGCLLHLPHIRRSHEMKTLFQLDVIGGKSDYLSVTLVNLPRIIKYIKDNVYLNVRPWYETFNTVIRMSNLTKYPLQMLLVGPEDSGRRLIDGYAKIMQDMEMTMGPLAYDKIKLSGILGFNENFQRVFQVLINDSASSSFRLRGQGILPILTITTPLKVVDQSIAEVIDEYEFMRIIYNYEIFKSITEVDEEPRLFDEEDEGEIITETSTDFSELSTSEDDMSSERQRYHDLQLFQMVHTYVLVNNNQELPNATVLNQMLVTERYLHRLRINPDLYTTHQKVYQSYVAETKSLGYRLPVSARHFTVQPLPCEQLAYVLDLGQIKRDCLRRFQLCMHFFGPGKLIAAARTAVRVPGLFVDFKIENHAEKQFTFWAEKCTEPEYFNKKYRNMWERLMDADKDPRVKKAHSFDFDEFERHQRDVHDKDRHLIVDYYNSLNLSVYPDHKHHFTLARVHTSYHSNFSGVDMCLVGFFKPEAQYYKLGQQLIDYMFIDLHMGPTMPILLRGIITS